MLATTMLEDLQLRSINAIRFLSADAVQEAKSGHAGLPMGAAAIAYALFTRYLRFNPKNPFWPDRDRFILSGGHGSTLLYSLLYLTGYDLPLEELKRFRRWGSLTPGHPEYGVTKGVETTTGPLGQGFATGVGMAIAEAHLASVYNRPGHTVIDHYTYVLATDGDLMEGVASEAASLAGHLKLGKLICFYDDNNVTIDGPTDLTFTEDRAKRFEAYGWQVLKIEDGNDVGAVDRAIQEAKPDPRPSLIVCRTHIGYGFPTLQDTAKAHSGAPGEAELNGAKRALGWPLEPRFYVSDDVLAHYRQAVERGARLEAEWQARLDRYQAAYPELALELARRLAGEFPGGWDKGLPEFPADAKGMPTRSASGKVINALARRFPELMGGSADLTTSNTTWIESTTDFQARQYNGRYLYFGVREHAMGAIVNGLALHKGVIPFGATFLVFSDYMRAAIRLSALSHAPSIWVFSHDSFCLGEDGPTHQPVEHLVALRAIPNLVVIRPADANETREAWIVAMQRRNGPTALALTRQTVPTLDRSVFSPASGLRRGAYVLADLGEAKPRLILMASGSEVSLIVEAGHRLAKEGIPVRLVSFPSWELFKAQDKAYQDCVFPADIESRLAVEVGVQLGWERWVGPRGEVIAMNRFGASAPNDVLFEKFGFSVENVLQKSRALLGLA